MGGRTEFRKSIIVKRSRECSIYYGSTRHASLLYIGSFVINTLGAGVAGYESYSIKAIFFFLFFFWKLARLLGFDTVNRHNKCKSIQVPNTRTLQDIYK